LEFPLDQFMLFSPGSSYGGLRTYGVPGFRSGSTKPFFLSEHSEHFGVTPLLLAMLFSSGRYRKLLAFCRCGSLCGKWSSLNCNVWLMVATYVQWCILWGISSCLRRTGNNLNSNQWWASNSLMRVYLRQSSWSLLRFGRKEPWLKLTCSFQRPKALAPVLLRLWDEPVPQV